MDSFSQHEALDRTFIVMEMFNGYVAQHEAIETDPELKEKASAISGALYELYNKIGEKNMKDQEEN